MAATMDTPVLEADGRIGNAQTERQFVEIIERAQARDDDGALLWTADGEPLIFRNFLATNAEKIFDAASTRGRCSADTRAVMRALDRKSTRQLQSLTRISYAVFCLKKKKKKTTQHQK